MASRLIPGQVKEIFKGSLVVSCLRILSQQAEPLGLDDMLSRLSSTGILIADNSPRGLTGGIGVMIREGLVESDPPFRVGRSREMLSARYKITPLGTEALAELDQAWDAAYSGILKARGT